MTRSRPYNDRFPTDPLLYLLLFVALIYAAGRLTQEQAQALAGVGTLAELALYGVHLIHGRR